MSWLSDGFKMATKVLAPASWLVDIGSDLLTNHSNEKAVQMQNEANASLWREQAEYNTPANQVARLRAAGLNPNLFYSQGSTGNMTAAPTMQANRYSYDFGKAIDRAAVVYQMRNLKAQNANLEATTGKLEAEKGAIKANTRKANVEADYKAAVLDYYLRYGRFPDQAWQTSLYSRFERFLDSPQVDAAKKFFFDAVAEERKREFELEAKRKAEAEYRAAQKNLPRWKREPSFKTKEPVDYIKARRY